jgi:hypothetical protein
MGDSLKVNYVTISRLFLGSVDLSFEVFNRVSPKVPEKMTKK